MTTLTPFYNSDPATKLHFVFLTEREDRVLDGLSRDAGFPSTSSFLHSLARSFIRSSDGIVDYGSDLDLAFQFRSASNDNSAPQSVRQPLILLARRVPRWFAELIPSVIASASVVGTGCGIFLLALHCAPNCEDKTPSPVVPKNWVAPTSAIPPLPEGSVATHLATPVTTPGAAGYAIAVPLQQRSPGASH